MEEELSTLFVDLQRNIDAFRNELKKIEENRYNWNPSKSKNIERLIDLVEQKVNYSAFLSISMLDLLIIIKNIKESKHQSEINYFIKNGYLLIYEVLNTYTLHNKNINYIIKNRFPELIEIQKDLAEVIREFKSINNYDSHIKVVRNNAAGHISKEFISYYDILSSFENKQANKTFQHFTIVLMSMQILSKKVSDKITEIFQAIDYQQTSDQE